MLVWKAEKGSKTRHGQDKASGHRAFYPAAQATGNERSPVKYYKFGFSSVHRSKTLSREVDTWTIDRLVIPRVVGFSGYVHTGPVPNGSDPKIVPDRPFVHTGPASRTVNPFPIRSENWTSKKAGPVFGTVPVPNGSVTV